jgi:peptidyl-prolyl cis-trans isomerase SurA
MRVILIAIIAFGAVHSAAAQSPPALSNTGALLDRIVAVVNEGIILKSQMDDKVRVITSQLREQGNPLPPPEAIEQQVLEQLIVQEVQLQRARRLGIRISDQMLNGTLQRIAERNGLTLTELPAALQAQGIDYARYREDVRNDMILDGLLQRDVIARISVSEREIERFLERQESSAGDQIDYDLSHILVAINPSAPAEEVATAELRIKDIERQLQDGADFAELAVTLSDGQNALQGGKLGWRKGAQLPAVFFDVVRDMKPGEISPPIRSPSGFHILRLDDVRGTERVVQLQHHTQHILLRPDEILDDSAVKSKLSRIRDRIVKNGEDFSDVARLESDDPGSAPTGGDLDWNAPGTFVPEFEEVVASLQPGEISEPFRTEFGWHIVLLVDRQERDTTDEVRRMRAIDAIRASKREQETEIWLRQLRDEAYVEVRG